MLMWTIVQAVTWGYVSGGEGLHVQHPLLECSGKSDVFGHWNSSRHCLCCWTVEPVQFLPCQSPLECDSTCIQVPQGTVDFGLEFGPSASGGVPSSIFSDSDYAGDTEKARFISGYATFIGSSCVTCSSRHHGTT